MELLISFLDCSLPVYRKIAHFCVFYFAEFVYSSNYFVDSLWFSVFIGLCYLQRKIIIPVPSCWMPFISFSFPLTRMSSTVFESSVEESGRHCLAPSPWGELSVFLWISMLVLAFSWMPFLMGRKFPSIPSLLSFFFIYMYHESALDFYQMLFLPQLKWSCVFFPFILLCIKLIAFDILNHPFIPRIKPTWFFKSVIEFGVLLGFEIYLRGIIYYPHLEKI